MTHSRHAELLEMLLARRRAIQEQVQQKIRAFRDVSSAEATRPPADLSDDPAQEDLDFALVEMQGQTLENINAALARLHAGEYGLCPDCDEEIPEKRLRALPFATRCVACQANVERIQLRDRRSQRRPSFAAVL
jgi:DnaK suppressor protein